jgi:hypothetical protein
MPELEHIVFNSQRSDVNCLCVNFCSKDRPQFCSEDGFQRMTYRNVGPVICSDVTIAGRK